MNCHDPRNNELPGSRFGVRGLAVAFQNAMGLSHAEPVVLESGGKPPQSKTLRSDRILPCGRCRRSGTVLTWCALLLPVLVGMVGLVVDSGKGVMFYNTDADYNPLTGAPDASDAIDPFNQTPPAADPAANFGAVSMTGGGAITLSPISTAGNPFNGCLIYQRRANTKTLTIVGNATDTTTGTVYAKWAAMSASGTMSSGAQFLVNTFSIGGNGTVTINYVGKNLGKAPQVYLVD